MENTHVKIIDIQDAAEHVEKFTVEKPDGFAYTPGQYGVWQFEEDTDVDRPFSFVSSPTDNQLAFATVIRDKSDFKQSLDGKQVGDELILSGPFGDFKYTGEDAHAVFVAGGIGITPFMSMLQYAHAQHTAGQITVLHSCKTVERTPFKRELIEIASQNENIELAFTLTDQEWDGPTGRIDAEFVSKFVQAPQKAHFYVAGPPGFVSDMESLLKEEVQAEHVEVDEFEGY